MTDIKYVAFDLHLATISAAVLDSSGKLMTEAPFQTDASVICDFLRGISGTVHLTFEEGTQAQMNRLKAVFRWQSIRCAGRDVYCTRNRGAWLAKLNEGGVRLRAEFLYRQSGHLRLLRREAKKALLREAQQQAAFKRLARVPGLGPTRVAQVMAAAGSPFRSRTKRQLWAYCGFGVITRSSADYRAVGDKLERHNRSAQTRGLNEDYSRGQDVCDLL